MIAREERCDSLLRLRSRTLDIFQVVCLVAVGLIMRIRGVRTESFMNDIGIDRLRKLAFSRDMRISHHGNHIAGRLVGDDVDDTTDGI